MRQLMVRQKKVLEKAMEEYSDLDIQNADDLPFSVWDKLVEINDTEILLHEVNRWIDDYRWSKVKTT